MNENEEYKTIRMPPKVFQKIEESVVNSIYIPLHITKVPIDPFDIAARLGYTVKSFASFPEALQKGFQENDVDGISLFDPKQQSFIIYYNHLSFDTRIRFTIMHEIGHIILGHKEESILAKRMADYFASYSLAPSPLIMLFGQNADIASIFNVSAECGYYCRERFLLWYFRNDPFTPYENELLDLFDYPSFKEEKHG